MSDKPRDAQLYLQFTRHGTVAAGTMFGTNTFTGPAIYTEQKKFQKIAFTDITKGKVELPAAGRQRLGGDGPALLRLGLAAQRARQRHHQARVPRRRPRQQPVLGRHGAAAA